VLHRWRRRIIDGQDKHHEIALLRSLGIPEKVCRLVECTQDRGTGSSSIKKMLELALGHCNVKKIPKKVV
jgi:hypothetical protein